MKMAKLIKSTKVTDGLYELAGNVVQAYQENEGNHPTPTFDLDAGVIYDMLVTTKKNNPFIVTINGRQTVDLTEIVKKELTALTDQFIDYVNSDQDVQYADTILIRDISAGTINENTVNQVLAKMGYLVKCLIIKMRWECIYLGNCSGKTNRRLRLIALRIAVHQL